MFCSFAVYANAFRVRSLGFASIIWYKNGLSARHQERAQLPLASPHSCHQQVAMTFTCSPPVSNARKFKQHFFCLIRKTEGARNKKWMRTGAERQAVEGLLKENKKSTHSRNNNIQGYVGVRMGSPRTSVCSEEAERGRKVCRQTWVRILALPPLRCAHLDRFFHVNPCSAPVNKLVTLSS